MKGFTKQVGIGLAVVMLCTSVIHADDKADVRMLSEKYVTLMNAGDAVSLAGLFHPAESSFSGLGDLLSEGIHTEASLKAMFDGGFKTQYAWRYLQVNVVGTTAVATGYWVGTATIPGGKTFENPWRVSFVWTKIKDGWQIMHAHLSPLYP